MKYPMIVAALSGALLLSACERPTTTVVTPAAAPAPVLVAVPGPAVEQVIRDCGARGIPAAVILSAGFGETDSETGTAGADRERQLLRTARASGPPCSASRW